VRGGSRRWCGHVRLLGEAALALGFANVSHGVGQIGVGTVVRTADDAVDDQCDFCLKRGDLLVAVDAFIFNSGQRFCDGHFRVLHVLEGRFKIGVASDTAELNGGRELRPCCIDLLGFNDYWINSDSPPLVLGVWKDQEVGGIAWAFVDEQHLRVCRDVVDCCSA